MNDNSDKALIPLHVKIFKFLNEEKKKHRKRADLLEAIKNIAPYMNIPEGHEIFLLEMYLLNYRPDGDYQNLTKDNFIDPRKQKGRKTTNASSNLYSKAQLPFKGSNLEGYWDEDPSGDEYYVVKSYGWYPVYIFKNNKWYENTSRYSSSTSKQMFRVNPVNYNDELEHKVYLLTPDEMKMLEQGMSHQQLMNLKLKKIKASEKDLVSKRLSNAVKWSSYEIGDPGRFNIKYKIKSIDVEGDKATINVDIYDVFRRGGAGVSLPTPENYLKGEIPNLTIKKVEDVLIQDIKGKFKDYIGPRFRYIGDLPEESKINFKFNHLKK